MDDLAMLRKLFRRRRRRDAAQPTGQPITVDPAESWRRLPPEIRTILESMYAGEPQIGSDGDSHPLDGVTRISKKKGAYLFELHERLRPELSVEVGLAYGFSTLHFLAAMKNGDYGHHVAMDPYQNGHWRGIGRQMASRVGMEDRFTFVDDFSVSALSEMAAAEKKAELVFVDGDHKFDGVLIDFTCAAKICAPGGYIVFDDLWMPSVKRVVSFVRANRPDFVEESTGGLDFSAFRRVGDDKREWTHYEEF